MGINCGDGYLLLDVRLFEDSSSLKQLLDTTTHEMRHQFQTEAVANPERYPDIPQETIETWRENCNNYIDPTYDLEGYINQPIERDANAFAEEVLADYMETKSPAFAVMTADATEGEMVVADGEEAAGLDLQSAGEAAADGLEANSELNAAASYTPAQCAKVASGTQNYCLFAGSGR